MQSIKHSSHDPDSLWPDVPAAAPPTFTRRGFLRKSALATSALAIIPLEAGKVLGEETTQDQPKNLPAPADNAWEFMLLDAAPPGMGETGGTAVGDIDGDGKPEIVIGGVGALLWYRPTTFEKGLVARGHFHVGLALADVDGDGIQEIVAGRETGPGTEQWAIYWFKAGKDLDHPGLEHVIDPHTSGGPHDLLFADLDGDGKLELVANAMYSSTPGLYIYKPGPDPAQPWKKQRVQAGLPVEGTAAGDLEGKGRIDLISGPYWFSPPAAGAFSGEAWRQHKFAPGFRDMCRVAVVDVNGDGRLDIVAVEDEYSDGHLSWFENRVGLDAAQPWVEHAMESKLIFPHSLRAWRDPKTHEACVFVGEMNEGGWGAPYNYDARLLKFSFNDQGKSFRREVFYKGEGTHEAVRADVDGDGVAEFVGHAAQVVYTTSPDCIGWVQIFKQRPGPARFQNYHHEFIDQEKPYTATDILWLDVDGDGVSDIVCGAWWYKNPGWQRHEIPGIVQVLNAYDIDNDGRKELIAIKGKPGAKDFYSALSSQLCWLKAIDPAHDRWEEHPIGNGSGDWPHGTVVAPLLPGGKLALIASYHDRTHPEIFEIPGDPRSSPWPRRVLAEIPYGEEMVAHDLDGDGRLDLVAGPYWLENLGNGHFVPHLLAQGYEGVARVVVADINCDGRPDIVVAEEKVDWNTRRSYFARVAWLENTGDPRSRGFTPHVIDRIICPHSLSVADLDNDGKLEIIAAEHDPFKPYQTRCRLFVYKATNPKASAWFRFKLDDRFEQHCGAKAIQLAPGKVGIIGHAWMESRYVHLWRPT
jgi:hypothetical protein